MYVDVYIYIYTCVYIRTIYNYRHLDLRSSPMTNYADPYNLIRNAL